MNPCMVAHGWFEEDAFQFNEVPLKQVQYRNKNGRPQREFEASLKPESSSKNQNWYAHGIDGVAPHYEETKYKNEERVTPKPQKARTLPKKS